MKKTICILAAATLLCGCNKARDQKIAALEGRVDDLQTKLSQMSGRQDALFDYAAAVNRVATNASKCVNDLIPIVIKCDDARLAAQSAALAAPGTAMPAATLALIKANAAKEFPGDFHMQDAEIKTQTEAWHKLNP